MLDRSLGLRSRKLRSHKVNEGAHRRGQMARLRIDEPDWLDVRLESVQHRNKLSLRDCGVGKIILKLCEPVTGAGGVTDCRAVAETHIAFGCEAFFNAFLHETPCPREAHIAKRKRQTIVVGQIFNPPRFSEFSKVTGRTNDFESRSTQPACDQ